MTGQNNMRAEGSIVAVLALVVAGIALIFALAAYDRAGRVSSTRESAVAEYEDVDEETEGTPLPTSQSIARARAESRLAALEARLAAQEGYEEAAEEVAEIRGDLKEAYGDASATAQAEWRELDLALEQLEGEVREKSAAALLTLQRLLEALRRDVATDDND